MSTSNRKGKNKPKGNQKNDKKKTPRKKSSKQRKLDTLTKTSERIDKGGNKGKKHLKNQVKEVTIDENDSGSEQFNKNKSPKRISKYIHIHLHTKKYTFCIFFYYFI